MHPAEFEITLLRIKTSNLCNVPNVMFREIITLCNIRKVLKLMIQVSHFKKIENKEWN